MVRNLTTKEYMMGLFLIVLGILGWIVSVQASYIPIVPLSTAVPIWTCVTKTSADFATASLTNNIQAFTLPAGGIIHAVQVIPITTFSGGAILTYTISVGTTGTPTKYSTATNVFTGATLPAPQASMGIENISASTNIVARATSTVGLLNAATQGSVKICALISKLP